nr:AraC family transcriptional regulator [Clostridioides difficile]
MFSRLFSILTEMTLSEYLRSRRLTEAAIILRDTDEKIIDVAFKFGYESSDSFGTAFKNFHGFTPSEVRIGKPFKLVSRAQLALSVRGGRSMNIRIQKKKSIYSCRCKSTKHQFINMCKPMAKTIFKGIS